MKHFVIIVICLTLIGCATPGTFPKGCENSVIYQTVPQADLVGVFGVVAIAEGLALKPEARPLMCSMTKSMMDVLDKQQITYLDFATILTDNVKWLNTYFGARILIYKQLFIAFDQPVNIDKCDLDYLKRNLNLLRTGC